MERLFSSWWHCWWRSLWSWWWWWISNSRVNIQSAIIVDRGCTYNRLRLRICVNMSMLCIEEGPCVCILHTMKMCVHCTIQCINTMDLLNNTSFLYRRHPSLNRGLQLITSYWTEAFNNIWYFEEWAKPPVDMSRQCIDVFKWISSTIVLRTSWCLGHMDRDYHVRTPTSSASSPL